jgi:hypothetical protein
MNHQQNVQILTPVYMFTSNFNQDLANSSLTNLASKFNEYT